MKVQGERTTEVGRRAENIASEYLISLGYKLLSRNWRYRHKELDLIFETANSVRVVEVRSLTAPCLVEPSETVNKKKKKQIVAAAAAYVSKEKIKKEILFDIVSIIFTDHETYSLDYLPNAFIPYFK